MKRFPANQDMRGGGTRTRHDVFRGGFVQEDGPSVVAGIPTQSIAREVSGILRLVVFHTSPKLGSS